MKIAFYLNNDIYPINQKYRNLLVGNPGIGGTEYEVVLIAETLSKRNNGLDVTLYVKQSGDFEAGLMVIIEPFIENAAKMASMNGCEYFIFDRKQVSWEQSPFTNIGNMKLVPWCHTFCNASSWQQTCQHPNIYRMICVGSEQRDLYRDDKSIYKTDYIFNCVPQNKARIAEAKQIPNKSREHIVTYIGSLTPIKTFHVLAEIWPSILDRVPDAELFVIGKAGLYHRIDELGSLGIAQKDYEKVFAPYISKNGKVINSVHFVGALGEEKNEILLKTKVGVPNPTGRTETFSITAVEMQMMGCTVTSMKAPGYFDTIYNGYMVTDKRSLADSIVKLLLEGGPKSYEETLDYIEDRFSLDKVVQQWESLFLDPSEMIHPITDYRNKMFRLKWLKEIIRLIKKRIPFLYKVRYTVENLINQKEKRVDVAYRLN